MRHADQAGAQESGGVGEPPLLWRDARDRDGAGHEPVVIVSLEDYESLRETAYLMRSPANARRLLDAMERLESGDGESHELIDAD